MAAKKRITRKELLKEPDKILTFSAKAIQWCRQYQNQLTYVVIGILAVVLLIVLFQYMSARSENKAFALFQEGLSRYITQVSNPKANMDATAKEKFDSLLTQHASSGAARLALPVYADLMYRAGNYDKAVELYRNALKAFAGDVAFEPLIWNGLGYAFEGKKEYASAVEWFQKAADAESDILRADAYFNLGRMYETLNEKEKALQAYNKVAEDFSQSNFAKIAKEKVERLKG
jgi:tetratricopeptide (TPR) repeat protein